MNIRSAANMPARVVLEFPADEGRTRQSMSAECDINNIMAKYQKSGAVTHFSRHAGRYAFATGLDFHEAMNVVTEGQRMFLDLPSSLRARFGTAEEFLDFVQDEANGDEMIDLGLRDPEAVRKSPAARSAELPPAGEAAPAASEAAEAAALASD